MDRSALDDAVDETPFADVHEHLPEEETRLAQPVAGSWLHGREGWALLAHEYLADDLRSAGMGSATLRRLFSIHAGEDERWQAIAPYWDAVRTTGYGRVLRESLVALVGLELGAETAREIDERLGALRVPGFYRRLLGIAGVASAQVNSLERTLARSSLPDLLLQDLNIGDLCMLGGSSPAGILDRGSLAEWERTWAVDATTLDGCLAILDAFFARAEREAVAAKLGWAYVRPVRWSRVERSAAEASLAAWLRAGDAGLPPSRELQDFLLEGCLERAADAGLPVKVHCGYQSGSGRPHLHRTASDVTDLCGLAAAFPRTTFVLMHAGHPAGDLAIAAAKQFPNILVDMSWTWALDPVAAGAFVVRFVSAAPASKLFAFGGDHIAVENVVGHARIARRGIKRALRALVDADVVPLDDAPRLARWLMRENAERAFPGLSPTDPSGAG